RPAPSPVHECDTHVRDGRVLDPDETELRDPGPLRRNALDDLDEGVLTLLLQARRSREERDSNLRLAPFRRVPEPPLRRSAENLRGCDINETHGTSPPQSKVDDERTPLDPLVYIPALFLLRRIVCLQLANDVDGLPLGAGLQRPIEKHSRGLGCRRREYVP